MNFELRVLDMNALGNPIGSTGGVQREQTMEEILASIRKIIESNEAINTPLDNEIAEFDAHDDEIEPAFEPSQRDWKSVV